MPLSGFDRDRVLRDGQDDDRDAAAGVVDLLDELQALDPALEQRVDEDDVRAQLADRCWTTRVPSVTTSSSLTCCWEFSRPRMYCATWGTSSTRSRRIWSTSADSAMRPGTVPRGPGPIRTHVEARERGCFTRHEYRALAARRQRPELVVARQRLHLEPGVLGESTQLVGGDEAQRVAGGSSAPAGSPGAPSSKIVVRVTRRLVGSCQRRCRPWSRRGRSRDPSREPLERRAGRRSGRGPSASGSQTSTTARPPGARCSAMARSAGALVGAGVVRMRMRVEREDRELVRPAGGTAALSAASVMSPSTSSTRAAAVRRRPVPRATRPEPASPGRCPRR